MPKYNTSFELDRNDLDLIESALIAAHGTDAASCPKEINDLLGRLHNQKVFYRPKGVYVSG